MFHRQNIFYNMYSRERKLLVVRISVIQTYAVTQIYKFSMYLTQLQNHEISKLRAFYTRGIKEYRTADSTCKT